MIRFALIMLFAGIPCVPAPSAEQFGEWSDYQPCRCDGTRARVRTCLDEPCDADQLVDIGTCSCLLSVESSDSCPMVHGAESSYGLVGSDCVCEHFLQCTRDPTTGEYGAVKHRCPPCTVWNQNMLTCVSDQFPRDQGCVYVPYTTPEPIQYTVPGNCSLLVVPGNPRKFQNGDLVMDCAPGTEFNETVCACLRYDPYEHQSDSITFIDFNGFSQITATKGIWLYNKRVEQLPASQGGLMPNGKYGFFNKTAESKIEIPYFMNAFEQFDEFTASFFFKASSEVDSSSISSLIDNSECLVEPTFRIQLVGSSHIRVKVQNSTDGPNVGVAESQDIAILADFWTHLVVTYDGEMIQIYVDGTLSSTMQLTGGIGNAKSPLVIGGCVCGDCYYQGDMDTLSFIKKSLNLDEVVSLLLNPSNSLP